MELVVKAIEEMTSAPYNPRAISIEALEGLRASIDRFGLVEPVIWNRQTGHVVGGHQRLKALEMSGVTETPVVVVDMAEAEERVLNVTLNNPAITGEFTPDVLPMLDDMEELDPEGFSELRLGAIREPLPDGAAFEPQAPDDIERLDERSPITCPECGATFVR